VTPGVGSRLGRDESDADAELLADDFVLFGDFVADDRVDDAVDEAVAELATSAATFDATA
jgi:hypothetical protein